MIGSRVRGNTLAHLIEPEVIKCHSQFGPRTKARAGRPVKHNKLLISESWVYFCRPITDFCIPGNALGLKELKGIQHQQSGSVLLQDRLEKRA
jgi:hypothetical protein